MIYRCILSDWKYHRAPEMPKVLEGEFTDEQIVAYNNSGYNIYWLPNCPDQYNPNKTVSGTDIDKFQYVFLDMDLKSGEYTSKKQFVDMLSWTTPQPTSIVDSGNGIHCYYSVSDLDAKSFLRLQRRLMRKFKTDEAVCKIYQLMRLPGTWNTKSENDFKLCTELEYNEVEYTCEQLDKLLPVISKEDEEYCERHYNQTYGINQTTIKVDETLPSKFKKLLRNSKEVKEIYAGNVDDRSTADYRLAHILFAEGYTKEEAMSVLVNCRKALERAPVHRINYAANIVEKIWTYENGSAEEKAALSFSVGDILKRGNAIQGTRFNCWDVFDATHHGFRLTEVLGLIGGSGTGKTSIGLNYFYWFTKLNPQYTHLFVALEQPKEEIALRWQRMTEGNTALHEKVHVLDNYNEDGSFRNLSLQDIQDYILELRKEKGIDIGCVVIDHIGALKIKVNKDGERQGLIDICHQMKSFAKHTNTFLVMQSQTSREKAGEGDLELDKDAAYGTTMFEWYCDYVVTTWQPIKRMYQAAPHMTCSAFKYCKIRHKNVLKDSTKEGAIHVLMFNPATEMLREMTQAEEQSFEFFNKQATTLRNRDRKREPRQITKIDWTGKKTEAPNGKANSNS